MESSPWGEPFAGDVFWEAEIRKWLFYSLTETDDGSKKTVGIFTLRTVHAARGTPIQMSSVPGLNTILNENLSSFYSPQSLRSIQAPRSFLHLRTPSPPSIPPSTEVLSHLPELCPALSKSRGLITQMLQSFHPICTLGRRVISPEVSSAQFSTVCSGYAHLLVLTLFIRFIPGIIIVLGFSCVTALFNPTLRRGEPIKWGLVSYTAVMFSIATVQTAMYFQLQSISYIDNREFPGEDAALLSPGPYGYQASIISEALSVFPSVLFFLSEWLADGFLVSYSFYAVPVHRGI